MIQADWERARERWRTARPDGSLTWYRQLDGRDFVAAVAGHGGFGSGTRVLEIGPGYGRLLQACLDADVPFSWYLGVDIAPANVRYLGERFEDPRVAFKVDDVETMRLDGRFDLLLASLVFKHLYPTFEAALKRCVECLDPGALVCFDVLEGNSCFWDPHEGGSYVRAYARDELATIVGDCGLELDGFANVAHDAGTLRLLTVARKP